MSLNYSRMKKCFKSHIVLHRPVTHGESKMQSPYQRCSFSKEKELGEVKSARYSSLKDTPDIDSPSPMKGQRKKICNLKEVKSRQGINPKNASMDSELFAERYRRFCISFEILWLKEMKMFQEPTEVCGINPAS